jgi:hypothetical protein
MGAAMIVAFASPARAQQPPPPVQTRVEAQWLEGRGAGRQLIRWRMARRRLAVAAWRRGYLRGWAAGRFWHGAAPARRFYMRPWYPARF